MKDLKPCPFCGGEVSITYHSADNVFSIWHKHEGCKFIEPMYIDGEHAKSLSDARNIWNKRSVPGLENEVKPSIMQDEENIWMTCSKCNYKLRAMFEKNINDMCRFPKFCPECGQAVKWE